jgi:hypothetical protein
VGLNILKSLNPQSDIVIAIKKQNKKILISFLLALGAIPFAYVNPIISGLLFFLQSAIWLIPDKNIERALRD